MKELLTKGFLKFLYFGCYKNFKNPTQKKIITTTALKDGANNRRWLKN